MLRRELVPLITTVMAGPGTKLLRVATSKLNSTLVHTKTGILPFGSLLGFRFKQRSTASSLTSAPCIDIASGWKRSGDHDVALALPSAGTEYSEVNRLTSATSSDPTVNTVASDRSLAR